MKEKGHKSLSLQVSTPILVEVYVHPAYYMKLRHRHYQMLENFYIKKGEGRTKTRNWEIYFIKENGAISIITTYPFILVRGQDTLIRGCANFKKDSIKITISSKNINGRRINRLHPRILSILLESVSTLMWFFIHNALIFPDTREQNFKKEIR